MNIDPKRDYSNQAAVPDFQDYFDRWRSSSAEMRATYPVYTDVPYGNGWRQTCDIFPASTEDAPVFVFVHGGWWYFLDKSDHTFVARPFIDRGAVVVLMNYPLAPMAAIEDIVESVRIGISWIKSNIARFGGDSTRITVSGHSAGGHLAAMAAQRDTNSGRSIDRIIRASIPISGLYDLNAILDTPHNKQIRMLRKTAEVATATRNVESITCKIAIAVGGQETPGFLWQHNAFKDLCTLSGKEMTELICAGANHFSILDDLSRPDSALFRTVWSELNSGF